MIILKSRQEIDKMRRAGRLVRQVLDAVVDKVDVGVTTLELDEMAEAMIREAGAVPAFKGYEPDFVRCGPFPATLCTSINEEVVHGVPGLRPLADGDILSIDTGVEMDGYFGDAAVSIIVGNASTGAQSLVQVTRNALDAGIDACRPGLRLGDISSAIQTVAEVAGFSVVRRFVGHGIGRQMHEDPPVPNYGVAGTGPTLKEGMVLALEPMVNMGGSDVQASQDCWPVVTKDGALSAHFEQTVAITEAGAEVLTAVRGEEGESGLEKKSRFA